MDITKINPDYIDMFGACYNIAAYINDVEPVCASANTKRKIRKWVTKHYIKNESLPDDIMTYIGKGVTDDEFILFLKSCKDHLSANGNQRKQEFEKSFVELSREVRDAFWELFSCELYSFNFKKTAQDVHLVLDDTCGHTQALVLHNASSVPDNFDFLSFEENPLVKTDDGYELRCEANRYEDDSIKLYSIGFTDVTLNVRIYNAASLFDETPWDTLQQIANRILSKVSLPGDCLNDKEKELLPLIAEVSKLYIAPSLPDEYKNSDFSELRSYIVKYKYTELFPLLDSLEKNFQNSSKKKRCKNKLIAKLNEYRYKPLWQEIYDLFCRSQECYPRKASSCVPNDTLKNTRRDVDRIMTSLGYQGEYPDYVKPCKIKGIHLTESYDMSYFAIAEKNVISHIHCDETYDDNLRIQFLCGTEFLKKDESPTDIYSCMFNSKGRKLYDYVNCDFGYYKSEEEIVDDDLEKRALIAAKTAELKKLTKDEKKELGALSFADKLRLFLIMYIIIGGASSILFTGTFIIIDVLLCLLFLSPQDIPSSFTDIPWLRILAFAWVLYGGAVAFITVSAKRK